MRLTRRQGLILTGTALAAPLAAPFVRPSWAQGGSVNVYNWADYIGETTLADFEAETGISVVYDLYPSSEDMEAKMLAGASGYDVVLQSGLGFPRMLQAGVYQTLDRAKLKGWENLDTLILAILEGWDPGNAHLCPYMWGSVGFTFNLDMVKERLPGADLENLDTVFLPENAEKLADCGISILDSPTDIMLIVLKYLGLDGDTKDVADYDKVVEAFARIRPHIQTFDNTNYLNAIPNGELCVVNNWSGDYGVAKARAAEAGIEMNLAYYVPKTGAPLWCDAWAIPADAANVDNAYAFLSYMLRPEVIAACTDYTGYANANDAATPLVDEAIRADPAVYPTPEVMQRLWAPQPLDEEQDRALTRAWQTIKAG
jgi:putrescine transport system substrate-binding protein